MSTLNLSIQHDRTLDDARATLRQAVDQTTARFGALVRGVDWSPGGDAAHVRGAGFTVDLRIDATHVHVSGDIAGLRGILGGPVAGGIKQIVQRVFQKRLGGR